MFSWTNGTYYVGFTEQAHLPFGGALNAESSRTNFSKRFTSYERSAATGLDYAQNRTYDSKQGRFTQVDPAGMGATSFANPQSLNLYAYCANDPINNTDPSGLGFFSFLKKIWKFIAVAVVVAVILIATHGAGSGFLSHIAGWLAHGGLGIAHFTEGGSLVLGTAGKILLGVAFTGAIADSFARAKETRRGPDKRILQTIADVRAILTGNNPCSDWFGKNGIPALDDIAAQMKEGLLSDQYGWNTTIGIEQGGGATDVTNAQTGARYRQWKTVTVNTNGPFLSPRSTSRIGGYPPASRQSRALQLLHEIAHKVPKDSGGLIPDDGGKPDLSEKNTKEVLKHCKDEIGKIKN
jgi:RHS repeat-associated protein